MKLGTRKVKKLCRCGCGTQLSPVFNKQGQHKGYHKYIKGHKYVQSAAHKKAWDITRKSRYKPIGTRRLITRPHHFVKDSIYDGQYWEIKITESEWKYEHRYIMEQNLGRPLKTNEHVHHKDRNGLNNNIENLEVLDAGEHASIAGSQLAKDKRGLFKYEKCSTCGWRHPPH